MPRRRTVIEPTALQLKVTLDNVMPLVWRTFLISPDASMWALHVALQDVMGWNDSHLHAFRVATTSRLDPIAIGIPTEDDFEPILPGWEIPIALVLRAPDEHVTY